MLDEIIKLRKELHQYPELSGAEVNTAAHITKFIDRFNPTTIIQGIGGNGLAAVYEFSQKGPSIVIRCELDALPIEEPNNFSHKSKVKMVSHKCGHDGHMAIVAGLIFWIKAQEFKAGRITLLFQPAEETGRGAEAVLQDQRFQNLKPNYIFALHNIPGVTKNSVVFMKSGFSAEVISFKITLQGIESHASEPEKGVNPSLAVSSLISELSSLNRTNPSDEHFRIITPIYMSLGQMSYGISPANAELHYTIRTWNSNTLNELKKLIEDVTLDICQFHLLEHEISWFEYFPAAANNEECLTYICQAAKIHKYELIERSIPFRFGEDFGWFSKEYPTAMFGLGAGRDCPPLHNPNYDFQDDIIEAGMHMFKSIISEILN